MGKSRKKTPIFTYIGHSNKVSKQICNRRFRKSVKSRVKRGVDPLFKLDEIMSEWNFLGDGKFYSKIEAKDQIMRK